MKVVHVISSLMQGGAEHVLCRVVENTVGDEYEHVVICLEKKGPLVERLEKQGIKVRGAGMSSIFKFPFAFFRLVRLLKEEQPDVVQTWMYHADLLGGLAARLASGAAVIWSLRQSNIDPKHTSRTTRLVIRICSFLSPYIPEKIISCSEAGKKVHVEKGYPADKIEVIPNAYDLDEFCPDSEERRRVRSELDLHEEDFLIGYVARFHPQKDHRTFVRAAGILAETEERAKFLLCGRGVTRENKELVDWIEKTGHSERFFLLGRREDIPAINNALDLATLTSYSEGFPNVVPEAMATGTPSVVTDAGDAAIIVADTGKVVPVRDPESLARAWQKFCNMPPEERGELGEKARERIKENYSIEAVLPQFKEIYKQLR